MTKTKWTSEDKLLMKVRVLLKSVEPRPPAVNPHLSAFGYDLVDCPICKRDMRKEAYNYHYSFYHGTKFWKEKAVIELIKKELAK